MANTYNQENDELEIDLGAIFMVLVRKIPMMMAVGLFFALVTFLVSKFVLVPTFESTTKVYILNKQENSNVTYSDLQMGTQLTKDYAELIKSRYVLEEVIHQLDLDLTYEQLVGKVTVTTPSDTRIISIKASDSSPVLAMNIANAIREAASVHITNVMDIEAVNVAETANLPSEKASPSVFKNTFIGGVLGVFLIAGIAILLFLLNDTIKTSEDVEKYLGLSTLALIPLGEGEKKSKKKNRRN
ncbi:MAG: protein-tyrosine kinase [Lachnospiraceae bacterium]|nr:protein-tyrosine kinase [Lachnospiraceae bacterium]